MDMFTTSNKNLQVFVSLSNYDKLSNVEVYHQIVVRIWVLYFRIALWSLCQLIVSLGLCVTVSVFTHMLISFYTHANFTP